MPNSVATWPSVVISIVVVLSCWATIYYPGLKERPRIRVRPQDTHLESLNRTKKSNLSRLHQNGTHSKMTKREDMSYLPNGMYRVGPLNPLQPVFHNQTTRDWNCRKREANSNGLIDIMYWHREKFAFPDMCTVPLGPCKRGVGPSIVVWGDSHVRVSGRVFEVLSQNHSVCIFLFSMPHCPSLRRFPPGSGRFRERGTCLNFRNAVWEVVRKPTVKKLILFTRWEDYLLEHASGILHAQDSGWSNKFVRNQTVQTAWNIFNSTLSLIRQKTQLQVGIVAQVPFFRDVNRYVSRKNFPNTCDDNTCGRFEYSRGSSLSHYSHPVVMQMCRKYKATCFDPTHIFCNSTHCSPFVNRTRAYADSNHVNIYGSMLLRPLFESFIFI